LCLWVRAPPGSCRSVFERRCRPRCRPVGPQAARHTHARQQSVVCNQSHSRASGGRAGRAPVGRRNPIRHLFLPFPPPGGGNSPRSRAKRGDVSAVRCADHAAEDPHIFDMWRLARSRGRRRCARGEVPKERGEINSPPSMSVQNSPAEGARRGMGVMKRPRISRDCCRGREGDGGGGGMRPGGRRRCAGIEPGINEPPLGGPAGRRGRRRSLNHRHWHPSTRGPQHCEARSNLCWAVGEEGARRLHHPDRPRGVRGRRGRHPGLHRHRTGPVHADRVRLQRVQRGWLRVADGAGRLRAPPGLPEHIRVVCVQRCCAALHRRRPGQVCAGGIRPPSFARPGNSVSNAHVCAVQYGLVIFCLVGGRGPHEICKRAATSSSR
jgi:hypothetical protein